MIHSFHHDFCTYFRYNILSDGSLHVHAVQLSDAGRYLCTVSNQAGSDHRGVDLRVYGEEVSSHINVAKVCWMHVTLDVEVCSRWGLMLLNSVYLWLLSVGPTVSPGPFNVTVTTGVRAVLSCETTGIPQPSVSWKRNGTPLDVSQHPGDYR